jgi:hypothetical protein
MGISVLRFGLELFKQAISTLGTRFGVHFELCIVFQTNIKRHVLLSQPLEKALIDKLPI